MNQFPILGLFIFLSTVVCARSNSKYGEEAGPYQASSNYQKSSTRLPDLTVSPIHLLHEAQWREYQKQHDHSQQIPDSYRYDMRGTWNSPPRYSPPSQNPSPLIDGAPTRPGILTEFKSTYADVVDRFIKSKLKNKNDPFRVTDDVTGETYSLRLVRIHAEEIRMVTANEAVACVDFVTTTFPERHLDIDFVLHKEWDWQVGEVFIHGINGRNRFTYNSSLQRVPVAQASDAIVVPKPTAPARLVVNVQFHEPSGDGRLGGGETGGLRATITNSGAGAAYGVVMSLDLSGSQELHMPKEISFGEIKSGESVAKDVPIQANDDVGAKSVQVTLGAREANGFDSEPLIVRFETAVLQKPRLELVKVSLPGGTVKKGELNKVSVQIRNSGTGGVLGVVAVLKLGGKDIFLAGDEVVHLGHLERGETKTAQFEFFINNRFSGSRELPIAVNLSDSTGRYRETLPLQLVLDRGEPTLRVVSIAARSQDNQISTVSQGDVDLPPKVKKREDPDAYAVVIGIEKYRDLPAVDFAARDAQTMYAYLTEAMGFKPENVVLLQNERAGYADLKTYLGPWLFDRVGPKSRVFIFYAGHGTPDPKTGAGYLIPYDGSPGYAETRAYPLQQIYEGLSKLPTSDILVTLDSCFSGAGGRSLLAQGTRPLVAMVPMPASGNTVTLSAAGADQISSSYPEAQHGLLTYFILKGLQGEADANHDGKITTLELYEYVKPAVSREARKQHVEQEPSISPTPQLLGNKASRIWLRRDGR